MFQNIWPLCCFIVSRVCLTQIALECSLINFFAAAPFECLLVFFYNSWKRQQQLSRTCSSNAVHAYFGTKSTEFFYFRFANREKKGKQQNVLYNLLLVVRQLEIWWVWTGFASVVFGCVKNQHLMTVPLKRWRWQFVPMKDESAPCGRTCMAWHTRSERAAQISHSDTYTLTNHIQIDCQNNKRPKFFGLLFNISMHTWNYFCLLARSHWPSSIPICNTFSSLNFHFNSNSLWCLTNLAKKISNIKHTFLPQIIRFFVVPVALGFSLLQFSDQGREKKIYR